MAARWRSIARPSVEKVPSRRLKRTLPCSIRQQKFTDVTDFDGLDSWPMWSQDGHIYFPAIAKATVDEHLAVPENGVRLSG